VATFAKQMKTFSFKDILPNDQEAISLISKWYSDEWSIPPEVFQPRIANPSPNDFIFHINAFENNAPVATGGLYWNVGLFKVFPEYKKFGPWIALLYTLPEKRGRGAGTQLLREIERRGFEKGYTNLYLFTNTAEALYLREGWQTTARMIYKEKDTVVMMKSR